MHYTRLRAGLPKWVPKSEVGRNQLHVCSDSKNGLMADIARRRRCAKSTKSLRDSQLRRTARL